MSEPDQGDHGSPSLGRFLFIGSKAFGINLLLLLGLHPLVPIAIFVPFGTGFATGWQIEATWLQGFLLGAIMGLWMTFLCSLVVLCIVLLSASNPSGLLQCGGLGTALIVGSLVFHLTTFAGVGAGFGGHLARKERAAHALGAEDG